MKRIKPSKFINTYLHDESPVNEPGSLNDAEVGAAELDQPIVVEDLRNAGQTFSSIAVIEINAV